MSINLKDVEQVPLTPELAKTFQNMPRLSGERRLKEGRCKYLRNALATGTFRDVMWSTCTIGDDPTKYRGDGQHSSKVLTELEADKFPQGLKAIVTNYHLDDAGQDVAVYFDMFNNPVSARTPDDRMHMYRHWHPELEQLDVPEAFLSKVAKVIAYYRQEINESDDERFLTIQPARERGLYFNDAECRAYALWLYQWRSTRNFSELLKLDNELLTETYYEWKESAENATELWTEVFEGSNPHADSSSQRIIAFFRATNRTGKAQKRLVQKARRLTREVWADYRAVTA